MPIPTCDLCLINPPSPWLVHPHAQAPLGILYVAAAAEAEGFSVAVRNLAAAAILPATWRIPQARVYGLTGCFLHIEIVGVCARELKRRHPGCRVIVGGPITLSRDELDRAAIDTIVLGEGERVIGDLLRAPGPAEIEGPPADVRTGLEPARHLWAGPFGGDVFIDDRRYTGCGSATLLTTRGCPFKCAFCASPALRCSPAVRFRRPEAVAEEMVGCVRGYGVRQFRLSDEFFTCSPEHAVGVCKAIWQRTELTSGDGIAWRASIGVRPNDPELFRALRAAGCREVAFGVESADPEVLDGLSRKGGPDDARTAFANARAAGLQTRALMMVGLPGTRPQTRALNERFLRSDLFDAVAITVFTPVPGCAIASEPERFGCRIIPERSHRSLCMYDAQGRIPIRPTIEVEGMTDEALTRQMHETIALAESLGRLGKG